MKLSHHLKIKPESKHAWTGQAETQQEAATWLLYRIDYKALPAY